uniref:Long-chain-fatty-acid--CoA ligase n=1 Tax=Syphacia muris TaxID=451379 RepID=A0A0N5APK7_9BILA
MWLLVLGTLIIATVGYVAHWIWLWKKDRFRFVNILNLNKQAVELQDEKGAYINGMLPDVERPIQRALPEFLTLYDIFMKGVEESNNGDCLGKRINKNGPYQFKTYMEVYQLARNFGSALIKFCGVKNDRESFVGLYAKNCPEWFITSLACIQQSIVIAPLYDTLDANAASYIVNQTEMSVVIVDSAEKIKKLLDNKVCPSIRFIVVIEDIDFTEYQAIDPDVVVISYADMLKKGEANLVPMTLPKPDDHYIICYTSGTTGPPKGVILTHRNLVASISSFYLLILKGNPKLLELKGVLLSYLPLSHMMEQLDHWCLISMGGSIGYYSGTIQGLMDDAKALRPSVFPVVPRLLNRIYDLIQANLRKSNFITRTIFNIAYAQKLTLLKKGVFCNDTIWDRFVFSKVQNQLGGNVQLIATGSAPVSEQVLETCRIVLGAAIFEAYGQTECTAVTSITWLTENVGGHCGGPAACAIVKLADVPEMNYFAKDGKGEIMVKGPNVTQGYYKNPEKTSELFDKDGYLHTGDIGQFLEGGRLKIIDRKKHIFKLAQGEYVAPEKIENVYIRAPCVQQVFVDGDSLECFLIAIVVPEEEVVVKWFRNSFPEKENTTYKDILKTDEANKYVLTEMQQIGKENKLNSIEQVKAIYLESEPFSIENNLLTPTLKSKRPQLRDYYKAQIKAIYDKFKKQK